MGCIDTLLEPLGRKNINWLQRQSAQEAKVSIETILAKSKKERDRLNEVLAVLSATRPVRGGRPPSVVKPKALGSVGSAVTPIHGSLTLESRKKLSQTMKSAGQKERRRTPK